jgi:hypothetical protein
MLLDQNALLPVQNSEAFGRNQYWTLTTWVDSRGFASLSGPGRIVLSVDDQQRAPSGTLVTTPCDGCHTLDLPWRSLSHSRGRQPSLHLTMFSHRCSPCGCFRLCFLGQQLGPSMASSGVEPPSATFCQNGDHQSCSLLLTMAPGTLPSDRPGVLCVEALGALGDGEISQRANIRWGSAFGRAYDGAYKALG